MSQLTRGPRIRRLRFDRPEAGGYKAGGEFGRPDCPLWLAVALAKAA
jgi:hypothetical protein